MQEQSEVCCRRCKIALVSDFSRPGKEWRCPFCGEFTEFFDEHIWLRPSDQARPSKNPAAASDTQTPERSSMECCASSAAVADKEGDA